MARDFRREYERRVQRGLAQGLSRSQARGHPRATEALKSGKPRVFKDREALERAVRSIRNGDSLTTASKHFSVSPESLRSFLVQEGIGEKVKGRWSIGTDLRPREISLFSDGQLKVITIKGYENGKLVNDFNNAVNHFLDTGNPAVLKPFVGKSVKDVNGKKHNFTTDPNTLYELDASDGDDQSYVYRIH